MVDNRARIAARRRYLDEGWTKSGNSCRGRRAGRRDRLLPRSLPPGLRGRISRCLPSTRRGRSGAPGGGASGRDDYGIATILGRSGSPTAGRQIAAYVFDAAGQSRATRRRTSSPEEEPFYVPEGRAGCSRWRRHVRRHDLPRGLALPRERPVGGDPRREGGLPPAAHGQRHRGPSRRAGANPDSPYYEKAMMMRSVENTVYFASVNYAMRYQESATSLIDPAGDARRTCPTGRKACWCRRSTSRRRPDCSPRGTRPNGIGSSLRSKAHSENRRA